MFSQEVISLVDRFKKNRPTSNFKRWELSTYKVLVHETNFLNPKSCIMQRLWHVENLTTVIPTCVECNKHVAWNQEIDQYKKFCSTSCVAKNSEVRNKQKLSIKIKYGVDYYTQASDFNSKRIKTHKKKYGTTWVQQNKHIRDKGKKTNIEKYGDEIYLRSSTHKIKLISVLQDQYVGPSQMRFPLTIASKLNSPYWLYEQHITNKKRIKQIAADLGVSSTTVIFNLRKHNIPVNKYHYGSCLEKEVLQFVQSIYQGTIIQNTKHIIQSGKELDIYLPDISIAIEICGLYWHSPDCHQRMTKNYHKEKYEQCKQQGIRLITMFEDEWLHRKDVVKLKISHILQQNNIASVGARQTTLIRISKDQANQFTDTYHVQYHGDSNDNVGIFVSDKLVGVCQLLVKNQEVLINRFVTSHTVHGGFSKVVKYIRRYYPDSVITSFTDLRWDTGRIYESNKFTLVKTLPPDYYYIVGTTRSHKFNFRHSRLKHKLAEYNPNKTEVENCIAHGFYRIWDCGKNKYMLGVVS